MYLLDTHTLLWYFEGSSSLSGKAKRTIDGKNQITVSIASFWEITIKQNLGKLSCTYSLSELSDNCKKAHFTILPITISHLEEIALLALLHRDPFDRLLIAQALAEKLIIITKDEIIPSYPVKTLW